jgi:coenzyme F420-dependent glucose-6-phosphate dehydrogenase
MTTWGYTLSSEEHGPRELVAMAARAEEEGFEFVSVSDHFHPWLSSQGNSPFVWSVVGGIAATTERIHVGTGVTCPILRTHPAIVAHAVATVSAMLGDRFFFGVGTGENLNEHVLGQHWPIIETRQQMLVEAVEVMRQLWTGETVDFAGTYYTVENARLYTLPDSPPPVIVSAVGPGSAEVAAEIGDGLWCTGPDTEVVQTFEKAGGSGPRYAQISICWAPTEKEAVRTVKEIWPNTGIPGQLSQDLPTPTHFEQAAELVTEESLADNVPCGPDPQKVVDLVRTHEKAGFDHLYFHQIGPDQEGFLRFWREELKPALKS